MPDTPDDISPQPLDYASPQTYRMAAIAQFPDETEAHMAAAKLESEGIGVEIKTRMPLYGMKNPSAVLAVHPDDVTAAVAVLEQTPARLRLIHPDAPSPQ
jgi:hypothetical protein